MTDAHLHVCCVMRLNGVGVTEAFQRPEQQWRPADSTRCPQSLDPTLLLVQSPHSQTNWCPINDKAARIELLQAE